MRYLAATLLGVLAGAVLAVAALYYNPLPSRQGVEPGARDWKLSYRFPREDTLLLAHNGTLRLPVKPAASAELWEATISKALTHAVVLTDEERPVGVASRISIPSSSDSGLLTRGVVLTDYWLVTLPGEGTLAVQADSNVWPFLKEALVPVWYLGREWSGPARYRPTIGPGFRNTAAVEGISGRYRGTYGTVVESYRVTRLNASGGELVGELYLNLTDETAAAAD